MVSKNKGQGAVKPFGRHRIFKAVCPKSSMFAAGIEPASPYAALEILPLYINHYEKVSAKAIIHHYTIRTIS